MEFHREDNGDVEFSPEITIFQKITKKHVFLIFLSKQARKKKSKI